MFRSNKANNETFQQVYKPIRETKYGDQRGLNCTNLVQTSLKFNMTSILWFDAVHSISC